MAGSVGVPRQNTFTHEHTDDTPLCSQNTKRHLERNVHCIRQGREEEEVKGGQMGERVGGWEVSSLALFLRPKFSAPSLTNADVSLVRGGLRCGCIGVADGWWVVGREYRWGGMYVEVPGSAAAILLTKKGKKDAKGGGSEDHLESEMQKRIVTYYTGCNITRHYFLRQNNVMFIHSFELS